MTTCTLNDLSYPKVRILKVDEERDLAIRAKAGDVAAREKFLLANMPLVIRLAARVRLRSKMAFEDLVQVGAEKLLHILYRFDPALGWKFSTYAYPAILREMTRQSLKSDTICVEEQARRKGVPAVKCSRFGALAKVPSIPDPNPSRPAAAVEHRESAEYVQRLMRGLSPRDRQVLSLRFGLDGGEPMTLEEVGEVIGVTREWVRQLQDKALAVMAAGTRINVHPDPVTPQRSAHHGP